MKRLFKSPLGRTTLSAGLLSVAIPMMAAGENEHPRRGHDRGRGGPSWQIVIGDPYRNRGPRLDDYHKRGPRAIQDVAPCELRLQAFQAGDQVILIASGENHGHGFTTCLRACDLNGRTAEIHLTNTPPCDYCGEGARTCFEVKGSFHAHCEVEEIEVKVAGECKHVRVVQVPRIG